jgi:3-deoxy-D-manno-octulosonate 8-phosphate phosphatase (KDO 8-P phosphatase)
MSDSLFSNDKIKETASIFENLGGQFIAEPLVLAKKIKQVKAFIFDWDGVFNDGRKGSGKVSDFAEPDTMALHTIRYAYWKLHGELPIIAIITGQHNEAAFELANREHLTIVFAGYKNKFEPIEILKKEFDLENNQLASTFDDIIDYPLMVSSDVRFLCKRSASPLFTKYVTENKLCDYITYSEQQSYPVREISELIIGMLGIYDETFISRFRDKDQYATFWDLRQSVETKIFKN